MPVQQSFGIVARAMWGEEGETMSLLEVVTAMR